MTLVQTSHGARDGRCAAVEPEGDRTTRSVPLAPGPLRAAREELLRSARIDAAAGSPLAAIRKLNVARELDEIVAVEAVR